MSNSGLSQRRKKCFRYTVDDVSSSFYRLFMFMCHVENEPKDKCFRLFWIKPLPNEPGPQYYDTLKDWFVCHAQVPERAKALVFVFVFVFILAHEQAISDSLRRTKETRL